MQHKHKQKQRISLIKRILILGEIEPIWQEERKHVVKYKNVAKIKLDYGQGNTPMYTDTFRKLKIVSKNISYC